MEEARPPSYASSPRTRLNMFLGTLSGLLFAGVVVLLIEFFDARVKTPEELKSLTGLNILGSVMRYQSSNGSSPITVADEKRHSPLVESYKFLQTNLEFAALGTPGLKSLLVTSSSPAEGKTTTAANLAVSMASEGKSVILVDADLRKSTLHGVFGIENRKGWTHVLLGNSTIEEALVPTSVGLDVAPRSIVFGNDVTVSVGIENTSSEQPATGQLVLNVDGVVFQERDVTLAAGETRTETFTIERPEVGSHTVEIEGLPEAFEVTAARVIERPAILNLVAPLTVSPREVDPGDTVTVSVTISNEGRLARGNHPDLPGQWRRGGAKGRTGAR